MKKKKLALHELDLETIQKDLALTEQAMSNASMSDNRYYSSGRYAADLKRKQELEALIKELQAVVPKRGR